MVLVPNCAHGKFIKDQKRVNSTRRAKTPTFATPRASRHHLQRTLSTQFASDKKNSIVHGAKNNERSGIRTHEVSHCGEVQTIRPKHSALTTRPSSRGFWSGISVKFWICGISTFDSFKFAFLTFVNPEILIN